MKDTFKTASFLSGRSAAGLDPTVSYGASRLRRVRNPAWTITSPTQAQGSTSGYTSGGQFAVGLPGIGNVIDKFPFASNANATDVGDLAGYRTSTAGHSSTTNGYSSGGYTNIPAPNSPNLNATNKFVSDVHKFPFATNSNASSVSSLSAKKLGHAGLSSTTNAYAAGGYARTSLNNTIGVDKFPFATDTTATQVLNLSKSSQLYAGHSSATNGYVTAGVSAPLTNTIDKFPFASDTNGTDIADLTQGRYGPAGTNSDANGYASGGMFPLSAPVATWYNTIDKFPFASDANATDVGDLTQVRYGPAGQSSISDGYTSGGYIPFFPGNARSNVIDKFPFASNANATDVGDLTQSRQKPAGHQV